MATRYSRICLQRENSAFPESRGSNQATRSCHPEDIGFALHDEPACWRCRNRRSGISKKRPYSADFGQQRTIRISVAQDQLRPAQVRIRNTPKTCSQS